MTIQGCREKEGRKEVVGLSKATQTFKGDLEVYGGLL